MTNEAHLQLAEKPITPFLRWAGSKRLAIPRLAALLPKNFTRYLEPFVGSAALFFHIRPKAALLSDLNEHLVNAFDQVRQVPSEIHAALNTIPRTSQEYSRIRSIHFESDSAFDRAVQFIYLNRNCFNGLFRTNNLGHFNVPFSSNRRGNYPTLEQFTSCKDLLDIADLRCGDFQSIIEKEIDSNDFVYLDPPYIKTTGRIFNQYGKNYFSPGDIPRLNTLLHKIDRKGAKFLLSFVDDPIIRTAKTEWQCETYTVTRNIAGFSSNRRLGTEVAIKNY